MATGSLAPVVGLRLVDPMAMRRYDRAATDALGNLFAVSLRSTDRGTVWSGTTNGWPPTTASSRRT